MNSTDTTTEEPKKKRTFITRMGYFFGNLVFKILLMLANLIWSKWIMLIFLLLFLYGPFVFIQISIVNPSYDTTPITNIAFAILAGISSVAFSWARAIEQDDKRLVRSIVYAGEISFQSAIFFLLASGFKYFSFKSVEQLGKETPFVIIRLIMLGASIILFVVAILNFLIALSDLLFVLRKRMKLGNNLPTDFDSWKD